MTQNNTQSGLILIAEDNEINQKVIKAILDRNGLKYELAKDGKETIDLFDQQKFSIILMDCQMPIMDGLKATQVIREHEKNNNSQKCHIIALTANAMSGDKEKCLAAGMDDFVSKPFKSQELIAKINMVLKKDSQNNEKVS